MSLTQKSDGQLLAEFAASRAEAPFEELLRRHGALVLGACRRVLGRSAEAEDAAQAVFLTLARKAGSLAGRELVSGWLYRVAGHVAARAREAAVLRRAREQEAAEMKERAASGGREGEQLAPLLDGEMSALPEKFRLPLLLHHLEGRSEEEGARLLGLRLGTFSSRLNRGRELLRERLARRGLVLSVGLLGGLLSGSAAAVELPAAFVGTTVKAAALVAAGNAAAGGLVSAQVVALMEGALRIMFWAKAKLVAAMLGSAAVLAVAVPAVLTIAAPVAPPVAPKFTSIDEDWPEAIKQAERRYVAALEQERKAQLQDDASAQKARQAKSAAFDAYVQAAQMHLNSALRDAEKPSPGSAETKAAGREVVRFVNRWVQKQNTSYAPGDSVPAIDLYMDCVLGRGHLLAGEAAEARKAFGRVTGADASLFEPGPAQDYYKALKQQAALWGTVLARAEATADPADLAAAVKGNTEFALDLYAKLSDEKKGENLFFSPYSISTALAMTYAGARENTAAQMAKTLHFTLEEPKLHPALAALTARLNEGDPQKRGYQLAVANALWGQKGYKFLDPFIALNQGCYGAGLNNVDFAGDTERARKTINAWVEKQTQDKIKELLKPGVLTGLTRLVLTNAIYFKGDWAAQFDKKMTRNMAFIVEKDKTVNASMMYQQSEFKLLPGEGFLALELPYVGKELSMIALLPEKYDGLPAFEKRLSGENLAKWLAALDVREAKQVIVFLPKFKVTAECKLNDTLIAMGMTDAFTPRADFSGMNGAKPPSAEALYISAVIHKAFVDVNEEGTEAAAATAVVMTRDPSAARPPPLFKADHPFVFLIRDNRSGSVLFLGRVINPAG